MCVCVCGGEGGRHSAQMASQLHLRDSVVAVAKYYSTTANGNYYNLTNLDSSQSNMLVIEIAIISF